MDILLFLLVMRVVIFEYIVYKLALRMMGVGGQTSADQGGERL